MGAFSVGIEYDYYDPNKALFVRPKCKNLKDEISNYKDISMEQYEQEIRPKADVFYQTKLVKSMKAGRSGYPRYGISKFEILSKDRIILYTDYTALSSQFTSTFRKSNPFEPIQAMKRRHSHYYWMSKLLRETIAVYGQYYGDDASLSGPFYCGMSRLMLMPQFAMKLFSPTSTSCQIAVAVKFSGEGGILIQFRNGTGRAAYLKGLDVSWISRFKEEDETYE